MTTKAQRKAIIDEKVNHEKARILEIMRKSDLYTITLDPLIESESWSKEAMIAYAKQIKMRNNKSF